ncbi:MULTISPECIES: class I adenylate-forming enzyme family protein [unclassified Streptomyces]|uniref:class I adenylate-forming enzyme family protein n=1 Tax=unclassified Streptomyces TaxID=2593676 RepID=UPI0024A942D9|nr:MULTISPECIES: class I adenylate-forming enzyme family protein [unclassified Streptomyces]
MPPETPARPSVYGRVPDTDEAIGHVPAVPLDGLLRLTAAAVPDRAALITPEGMLRYAELDALVDGAARVLAEAAVGPGAVVGVVSALTPAFAVAYYGTVRARCVVAIINPFLRGDALAHILGSASVTVVVAPPEHSARVEEVRDRLEGPLTVLSPEDILGAGYGTPLGGPLPEPGDMACAQFTSGTTGAPKTVRLTHRNLVANATQIAAVHGLDSTSVTVNHLPLFHPMHLNSAVRAGATQVLVPDADPAQAVGAANRHTASHYYSLPVRLAHLAADPRLPQFRLKSVRAVFSGGSALLPTPARVLSEHFGIPFVQGYGLAETSPLTHCQRPADPVPGSVGRAVPGTEHRIVDIETRSPVPPGSTGEVQVRGPQVMAGYAGDTLPAVDENGWFSSGDVGREDARGNLFLTDRIKDVFKYENWVVAPTEIEEALVRHPLVDDCAVVDRPDPAYGAVAHGLLVLSPRAREAEPSEGGPGGAPGSVLERIREQVNRSLPYYQRLRYVETADSIPRSPNGKILRRVLREQLARNPGPVSEPAPGPTSPPGGHL